MRLLKACAILVITGLAYLAVKDIHLGLVLKRIGTANPYYIALAFLAMFLMMVVWNLKWAYLLQQYVRVRSWHTLPILFAGVFVNHITPGAGIGGEPVRAYFVSKEYPVKMIKAFAAVMMDKLFNTMVIILLFIFSLIYGILVLRVDRALKAVLATTLILLLITTLLVYRWKYGGKLRSIILHHLLKFFYHKAFSRVLRQRFATYKELHRYVHKKIKEFMGAAQEVLKEKRRLLISVAFAMLYYGLYFLAMDAVFRALHVSIRLAALITIVSISSVVADISFTPGGLGLTEVILLALYQAFGLNVTAAASITLLQRAIYYFYMLGIGYLCMLYLTLKKYPQQTRGKTPVQRRVT